MIYLLILLAFIISIIFSMLIIPRILIVALTKRLFDMPNERKIHTEVIPRLGGISFAPTILFSLAFVSAISYLGYLYGLKIPKDITPHITPDFYLLICGLIILYLAGIKDDLIGLRSQPQCFPYRVYGSITFTVYSGSMSWLPGWGCR